MDRAAVDGVSPGAGEPGPEGAEVVLAWVLMFYRHPELVEHTVRVLAALPGEVREDLMGDPDFLLNAVDPHAPGPMVVRLGRVGPVGGGSRSVTLKTTLTAAGDEFAAYIIAHEFAHAFLRNVCGPPGADVEAEADALAARWGFPRPPSFATGLEFVRRILRAGFTDRP